jgi:pyridoxine 5-phosphate synthase
MNMHPIVRFHVNIDHVATVRNARGTTYPDPVAHARLCEEAGADGITAHLREDRRHINDEDLVRLRREVKTHLNLEMAATEEMSQIAERVHPDTITLVPERREERTTEGGLDVIRHKEAIRRVAQMTQRAGIRLSLFIAPDLEQVRASVEVGARQVEFHTGVYCHAEGESRKGELIALMRAGELGAEKGLCIAAGHGLTVENLVDVVALPMVEELNIGHAVIADALAVGLPQAVRAFRAAIERGVALR